VNNDVDLLHFGAFRRLRQTGDRHCMRRNVDKVPGAFIEEMMMIAGVGIEINAVLVDDNLAQKPGTRKLMEGIVDGGERDLHAALAGRSVNLLRRHMLMGAVEEDGGKRAALLRKAQARILQKHHTVVILTVRLHEIIMSQNNAKGKAIDPPTGIWGKVIGAFLGFALGGGPIGAIFGIIIGHIYDSRREHITVNPWAHMSAPYDDFAGSTQQAAFTVGVIVLGAKMAKADGRVTREEIEAFKRVFQVSPTHEEAVGKLFNQARRHSGGFEPYAFRLAQVFRHNPAVLEQVLGGLFIIAASDSSGLSPAELKFLRNVSVIFGFGTDTFARIAARSGVELPESQRPKTPLEDAYAILGVKAAVTDDEVKTAYRALIREHHPDGLVAQGMPPEFIAVATEKMKRINVAYDTVCKTRGIK
jgi:DnaJ like chaperone protein